MQSEAHKTLAEAILPNGELLIHGSGCRAEAGRTDTHINPSTGQAQKQFSIAGPKDVDRAVASAKSALPQWRGMPSSQRRNTLLKIADLLEKERDDLGKLAAIDNGTPVLIGPAIASDAPVEWFRYYAGWTDKFDGSVPPSEPGSFAFATREPYGVVAALVAFNAPMSFMGLKIAAALAAGNTVVIKPSELAPWSVLRFGEICREAGIPDGVVNVIPGDGETGRALVSNPLVNKISFTGGDGTARAIMAAAAENLTPLSFELGGKSASIIFDDAKLDTAIQTALQISLITLSGQACIAGTRLLVQRSIYDAVCEALAGALGTLNVGDPLEESTLMGPIISEFHCDRILKIIDESRSRQDGKLIGGGHRLNGDLERGYFVSPAVFVDVDPNSWLAQNEVFGPVLSVIPFDDDEHAVEIANNSRYGLSAYIFTQDLVRAHKTAAAIDAGCVCVNSGHAFPPNLPFGGMKSSGFGREGGYDGIFDMTHSKAVQFGLG